MAVASNPVAGATREPSASGGAEGGLVTSAPTPGKAALVAVASNPVAGATREPSASLEAPKEDLSPRRRPQAKSPSWWRRRSRASTQGKRRRPEAPREDFSPRRRQQTKPPSWLRRRTQAPTQGKRRRLEAPREDLPPRRRTEPTAPQGRRQSGDLRKTFTVSALVTAHEPYGEGLHMAAHDDLPCAVLLRTRVRRRRV